MSAHAAQVGRQRAWAAWLAAFSLPLLCGGQVVESGPAAAAVPPAAPGVQFRALEVHDRREALADLLQRLTAERDCRREEHRVYIAATAAAQSLATLPDADQKLRVSMTVAADLGRLGEQLKESRLRRLEILDRIQAQAAQTGPAMAEGAQLLREADAEVRLMLSQQVEQARRTGLLQRQLAAFVNAIPAPAEFCAASAVVMRLVGVGENAFYVSAAPLSVGLFQRFLQTLPSPEAAAVWTAYAAGTGPAEALTGISWYEARRLCQWLSAQDGIEYRLPVLREATLVGAAQPAGGLAFWGDEAWVPEDHAARRDLKRFGVDLVTVWDPRALLAAQPGSTGEVPFARYPSLSVYVVAARQAGVAHRWQRLKAAAP